MSVLAMRSTANALVGREPEIEALLTRLDESLAGHGGVVLLAGEPGIGKTRLLEEMTAIAEARGAGVLWGRCYEGEGAPAFWPWIQILRAALRDAPAGFVEQFGPGADDLAQLVPEIQAQRTGGAGAAPVPAADPAEARFRLFDRLTAFLTARAVDRPQMLILDDLHWADASSLLLLQFLARGVRAMPLLVLGAYRDVEVSREHPLATTIAMLSRERGYEHLGLHGVSLDAVAALLADACGTDRVASTVIRELYELTAGNPLFIQETLRHLIETGRLTTHDGAASGEAPTLTAIEAPEGVRWVLRQRLARLPENAAQVLSIAAVIGHEFDITTLAAALESDGLPVIETLDAAETARLVATVPGSGADAIPRYRFEHDLIRETLEGDLSRAARVRLHQRVGEALEDRWRIDPDAHLSELAHHFVQAAPGGSVTKAITYARRAGDHAARQFAYDEAARWYATALDVMGFLTPADDTVRCDLLLALGEALLSAGEPTRVVDEVAPAALALAEALGEEGREQAAHVCRIALTGLVRSGGPGTSIGTSLYHIWADRADRYAPPESRDRVHADIAQADVLIGDGALAQATERYRRALELARRLDDPDTYFFAAFQLLTWHLDPHHPAAQLELAREVSTRRRDGVGARNLGRALWACGSVFFDWGERDRGEVLWREVDVLAAQTQEHALLMYAPMSAAFLATLDGRLEEALREAARLIERSAELGGAAHGRQSALFLQERPLHWLGPAAPLPPGLPPDLHMSLQGDVIWTAGNATSVTLRRAQEGDLATARRELDTAMERFRAEGDQEAIVAWPLVKLLELAVLLEDRKACDYLAARVAPLAPCATGRWAVTAVARHLGAAAVLRGDRRQAREHYEQALAAAGAGRFRPEVALTTLQLAELLAEEPAERGEARRQIEHAIDEFRAMKMQPALERALALQDRLRADPGRAARPVYPAGLTAREVEVLGLVATGATNREIASALFVTPGTVHQHLVNIFAKIGARRRADAAAFATRHDLVPPAP